MSLLVGATASTMFVQTLVTTVSSVSKMLEACADILSPVCNVDEGVIVNVTNPSPLWVMLSLTGRKPALAGKVAARPVAVSMLSNIQKARRLVRSRPAVTSTTTPVLSRTSRRWV